jgi:1-acyl-sn-glycerol-3-phosphate acyltransferase
MAPTPQLQRFARFARLLAHFAQGLATLAFRFGRYSSVRRGAEIQRWSRGFLRIAGVRVEHSGVPPASGLVVMNHISWLDIIVLNSVAPSRFVSKSEVARWPLVGYLCTKSGTLYIDRSRKTAARRTNQLITDALVSGERVAVFPEGTTTVGDKLLHFHAALLQPAIASEGRVTPIALRYLDPQDRRSPAVSYVGDETLVGSVWQLVSAKRTTARLEFGAPELTAGRHRRELAEALRGTITRRLGLGNLDTPPGKHAGPRSSPQ